MYKESLLILRHLERQINIGVPMDRLALDRGYETGAVHCGLELLGITGSSPRFNSPMRLRNMVSPTSQNWMHCSQNHGHADFITTVHSIGIVNRWIITAEPLHSAM